MSCPHQHAVAADSIFDGSAVHRHAAVLIEGERIAWIGPRQELPPDIYLHELPKGCWLAPGFIDVHTHLEGDETKDPDATNFILDGVTTCITGNCGASNTDIGKYLGFIDSLKLSINVATLVGHNDIRKQVMGRANREATPDEMEQMRNIVDKAMRDGAVGLSTGLIYIPGTYTKTPEIVELAKVVAKYDGVYTTHMRDEGDSVVFAINEALTVGREARLPVEISHFKLSGQQNWGKRQETYQAQNVRLEPPAGASTEAAPGTLRGGPWRGSRSRTPRRISATVS